MFNYICLALFVCLSSAFCFLIFIQQINKSFINFNPCCPINVICQFDHDVKVAISFWKWSPCVCNLHCNLFLPSFFLYVDTRFTGTTIHLNIYFFFFFFFFFAQPLQYSFRKLCAICMCPLAALITVHPKVYPSGVSFQIIQGEAKSAIVKFTELCIKIPPKALLNFACDG